MPQTLQHFGCSYSKFASDSLWWVIVINPMVQVTKGRFVETHTKICHSNWSRPELKTNIYMVDTNHIKIDVKNEMPSVVLYMLDNPDD